MLITDLQIGGTPTVVRELAVRLHRPPGVVVEVACLAGWGPVADQLTKRGIKVTPLYASGIFDVGVLRRLKRLIRHRGYDTVFSFLVHANALAAAAAMRLPDLRYFQSIQTTQRRPRWHWLVQGVAQRKAERVAVPSPSVAETARKWAKLPFGKLVVIPNAVEMSDFSDMPSRAEPPRPVRVGFIGRLDPIKRIPDLLKAVRLLGADYRLEIFGEGSERSKLQGIVQRDGLQSRVKFHGAIDRPRKALEQIDLLVLPSAAEGFGLVLIEAMAAGVPVVATNVPGIRDVVQDGRTGLLTPVASPKQLAKTVARLIADSDLRRALTAAGRVDVAARFTWEKVLPQYRTLLGLTDEDEAGLQPSPLCV